MKRTTISLPDTLHDALDRYRREHEVRLPLSAMIQAAIREYLMRRGYEPVPAEAAFRITPAEKGSGIKDISANHDRYFGEATDQE